ncbi:class V chitinase Chi100 [Cordyceps fumosorosea ARSEF 2679]|uniref:chitinase n=1 Tax=Cordyceps fumosorosea (strain ARSEF 2679) TaxID=1081104 RepID=A0A162JTB7_CORFA|nr:class V chitinase Chi100 [Cordyceps fumosorosea ARSEF 2679]OAA73472.1 class V chitinase Chi100 [Cordyceps fumosorosea ARSEF 2679]
MRSSPCATAATLACVLANAGAFGLAGNIQGDVNSYLANIPVSQSNDATQSADRESARLALLAKDTSKLGHVQHRIGCPTSCFEALGNTTSWFLYGGFDALRRACNSTMLLDFALFNPVDGPDAQVAIHACAAGSNSSESTATLKQRSDAASCSREGVARGKVTSSLQLSSSGSSSAANLADITASLDLLKEFYSSHDSGCNEMLKFASSGNAAVGVYAGSGLAGQGVLTTTLDKLRAELSRGEGVAEQTVVQLCGNSTARYTFGIYIGTDGEFGRVQRALQSWKNGTCVDADTASVRWEPVTFTSPLAVNVSFGANTTMAFHGNFSGSSGTLKSPATLTGRGDGDGCSPIQVEAGDSVETLARECGLSIDEFAKDNPGAAHSAVYVPGQRLCCSAPGTASARERRALTPDADGYCHPYLVKMGDSCSALSATYGITNDDIEEWNKKTWGWNGCNKMFAGYNICLSKGYPPMPAPVKNAVCGPQVKGTGRYPHDIDPTSLNTCRLRACCNIWGQCGTTGEFCTPSKSPTGAPGTAAPGENGCISNCGTDVITGHTPKDTYNIAYFEAYDWDRPCLRMGADQIDASKYTHAHFSFAVLTDDLSISVADTATQFDLFRGLTGIKKIVAIGGWAFSTDPATYQIFRSAFRGEVNRSKLIDNVVKFLTDNDLDGVDWDWEYPDEPDIPGIPPGTLDDQVGFYLFFQELKKKMPEGKTVSVTAPASYWYLQHFPIQGISLVVDYIVFMTYDLHGQWDYTNKYSSPGCGSYDQGLGNCLRSHVNLTETINALSMITKAGVPSDMIVVGVSSYGRSFQMSEAGCWTEQCTYTGPESGAYKGRCTGTAGYISDFEINEILAHSPSAQTHLDPGSYSDIVVFNNTQWVAHMSPQNKAFRKLLYKGMKFLGTADWAVDLQSESGEESDGAADSHKTIYVDPKIWQSATQVVTAPPGATLVWPPMPLASPTTITFEPWSTVVSYSSPTIKTTTRSGITSTYPAYVYVTWHTILTIPPLVTTAMPVWGVPLSNASSTGGGPIILTSSVQPPPFTILVTPVIDGTTSIVEPTSTSTTTPAAIIWGTKTYVPPVETETFGKSTIIIGGRTLLPTGVVVTPHPYPSSKPTPGTTDPVLNSKTPKWKSGKVPEPTAEPDCPGCGKPCLLWCDSDCPFCPPNVFGSGGGGGSSGSDPDDPDDPDRPDSHHTVLFDGLLSDDVVPATVDPYDVATSAAAEQSSYFESVWEDYLFPHHGPATTLSIAPAKPMPYARCIISDSILWWTFTIYDIDAWAGDGGKKLHSEESGCGAITGWTWQDESSKTSTNVVFNLPLFIKDGCVERAIVSAGGPKISCVQDYEVRNHPDRRGRVEAEASRMPSRRVEGGGGAGARGPPPVPYTVEEMEEFARFYISIQPELVNMGTHPHYVPMDWGTAGAARVTGMAS